MSTKNASKEILFCFLDDYESLEEAFRKVFLCSKSILNKYIENKKKLKQKVYARKEYAIDINLVNYLMINPAFEGQSPEILFENENYIVLNKAMSLHSHPLSYNEVDNCLSFLRANHYGDCLKVNSSSYDKGLLYRLDLVTSGVLVYVKNENLLFKLRDHYGSLIKQKTYLAIVEGRVEKTYNLSHYFKKSQIKGKKIKVFDDEVENSRQGLCVVNPIKFNPEENISLIKIELKTGLRHQIRAQLSHVGLPILGDELYGGKSAARVFLHAYNYVINVPEAYLDVRSIKADLFESFFNLHTCL